MVETALQVVYKFADPNDVERFGEERARDLAAAIDRDTFGAPSWIGGNDVSVTVKFLHFSSLDAYTILGTREVLEEEFGPIDRWEVQTTSGMDKYPEDEVTFDDYTADNIYGNY